MPGREAPPNEKSVVTNNRVLPVPDPTELTTQALREAIANQKELFTAQVNELRSILVQHERQLEAMPQAIKASLDVFEKLVVEKIQHLADVTGEKFERVDSTLAERATQAQALATQNTKAIDTAFQSAEKAVSEQNKASTTAINKSEASVADSLKQLQERFQQGITAANDKADANAVSLGAQINDVKSRLDKGEGKSSVADPAIAGALNEFAAAIAKLTLAGGVREGVTKGVDLTVVYLLSGGGFFLTLVTVGIALAALFK